MKLVSRRGLKSSESALANPLAIGLHLVWALSPGFGLALEVQARAVRASE